MRTRMAQMQADHVDGRLVGPIDFGWEVHGCAGPRANGTVRAAAAADAHLTGHNLDVASSGAGFGVVLCRCEELHHLS